MIQAQTHLLCTDREVGHLPAYLGGRGLVMFRILRNGKLCMRILEVAEEFWQKNVLDGVEPDDVPSLNVLKRIRREPNRVANIPDDLLISLATAKQQSKETGAAEKKAKAAVIAALGDAEGGVSPTMGSVTYYLESRKGYTVGANEFRMLRLKKPKQEK